MQVIPDITNPILVDKVVKIIKTSLKTNVSWLEFLYGLVSEGIEEGGTYPMIYANDGSTLNHSLTPDNSVTAYCFFEINEPSIVDEHEDTVYWNLSLVVYARLDLIDSSKTYDYTGELISEIMYELRKPLMKTSNFSIEQNGAFDKYSLVDPDENQEYMRQASAFRINFTVEDHGACFQTMT